MRGFHVYKAVYEPSQELLTCVREPGNVHNPYAVAMMNGNVVVGHVPRLISALCAMFITQGGVLECRVTGHRRYSSDLPQGGLELPCHLYFTSPSTALLEKVKSLLQQRPQMSDEKDETAEPPEKKIKCKDSVDDDFEEQISETSEVWQSYNRHRLTLSDKQKIIDGSMLNDKHINFAQCVLKIQFNLAEGLGCTFYQYKPRSDDCKIQCGLQIVHCRARNHWILATNLSKEGMLDVYDSVYSTLDEPTHDVLKNLFLFKEVRLVTWQKQTGGSDCGLFSIAAATQLLVNRKENNFHFCQTKMRDHVLSCYEKKEFSCFPSC